MLFDVYAAPQFVYGSPQKLFAIAIDVGHTAVIVEGEAGKLLPRRASGSSHVRALSERLRQGYERQPGRRFFNPRSQQFTLVHPDLEWKGAKPILLSRHQQVHTAAETVARIAQSTPGTCITSEEISAWLQQQHRNAAHVVAFSDHPIWALALGEAVLDKGWDWRVGPELTEPPRERPSTDPAGWCQWLQQIFERKQIAAAQAGLGWTVEALLKPSADPSPERDGLAALL